MSGTTPQFFIIPLPGGPVTFEVQLVNAVYKFSLQYCNASALGWVLTISNTDGTQLMSTPLVSGIDLLDPH